MVGSAGLAGHEIVQQGVAQLSWRNHVLRPDPAESYAAREWRLSPQSMAGLSGTAKLGGKGAVLEDILGSQDHEDSILGRFWLPQAGEQTAVHGVMVFGEEGATVRLHDAVTEYGLLADETVFAKLQGHYDKATLTNCYAHAMRKSDGTVASAEIQSTLVALGSMREDLGGHAIQFRLIGAQIWFNELCFDMDRTVRPEITIRFKRHESFLYELPDGFKLERFYSSLPPLHGWGLEQLGIHRPMQFRIFAPERMDIDTVWQMTRRLRQFFEFLSQNQLPHANLKIYDEADPSADLPDIQIRHSRVHAPKPRKFEWDMQLVQFNDIEEKFPALLCRWFEVHRDHPEPFSRYFSAFDRNRADPVQHFLWNVAALEELHKLRTTRDRRQFDLLGRLKDVRTRWSSATKKQIPDGVLKEIADTRHYYAHAAGDLRDRAATDWKLLRYGDCVAVLSSLEMLSLLGLTDEEVVSITRHSWLQETLALDKYPTDD